MIKRLFIVVISMMATCSIAKADIATDMQNMFDNMGVYSNVTPSAVYEGESNNLITGGSLYLRAPVKNYSLYNFQLPSFSGGCGGIDWFLGSFGFASKQQFIDMMRNIGNNLIGVAFQMAIDSMSSMLGINMKEMKKLLADLTMDGINTCKTAKWMMGAVADQLPEVNYDTCVRWAQTLGRADNEQDAKHLCQDADNFADTRRETKDTDPDNQKTSPQYTGGNIVWALGLKNAGIQDWEADIIMAMTGILVAKPSTDQKLVTLNYHGPKIKDVKDLLHGAPGQSVIGDVIKVNSYNCTTLTVDTRTYEKADCTPALVDVKHIPTLIQKDIDLVLNDMLDGSKASVKQGGTGYSSEAATAMGRLMAYSSVPIRRVLAYDMATGLNTRDRYINLMALDHLEAMVESYAELAVNALDQANSVSVKDEERIAEARKNIVEFKRRIRSKKNEVAISTNNFINIEKDVIIMTQRMQSALGSRVGI